MELDSLDKQINECRVLQAELQSRKQGKPVYRQFGSGLVLYEDDPDRIMKENQFKLKTLENKRKKSNKKSDV